MEFVNFGVEVWKDHKEWLVGVPGVLACIVQWLPETVRKAPGVILAFLWVCLVSLFKYKPVDEPKEFTDIIKHLQADSFLSRDSDDVLTYRSTQYHRTRVLALFEPGREHANPIWKEVPLTWRQRSVLKKAFDARRHELIKERDEYLRIAAASGGAVSDTPRAHSIV